MPNGDMPSWDEWNGQLSEEQRQYSLYKILESLNKKMADGNLNCQNRELDCNLRFNKIEKHKWWNPVAASIGGIIGGIITVIGGWAFWKGGVP
jgi:hypothetical protein